MCRWRGTCGTGRWQICILRRLQQICVLSLFRKSIILLAVPLLTHGHGTIYEAFPSETHCKIYFRFIYVGNAKHHNQPMREYTLYVCAWASVCVFVLVICCPLPMCVADNELCERLTVTEKIWKTKKKEKKCLENTEIKRDKTHKANARHNGHLDRQIYR